MVLWPISLEGNLCSCSPYSGHCWAWCGSYLFVSPKEKGVQGSINTYCIVSFGEVLNLKWIWFGNAFLVIGGGPALVKSMYYAIISDVAPEEKR